MSNYIQGLRDAMEACQGVRESGCEARVGAVECIDAINETLIAALAAPAVANGAADERAAFEVWFDGTTSRAHAWDAWKARAAIASAQQAAPKAPAPNMDDWNVQMACVKAMLSCTEGELECIGEKLLYSYIGDVQRVVAAALASIPTAPEAT